MAKEWILNSAMNRFQLNFKRNVGRATHARTASCASLNSPLELKIMKRYFLFTILLCFFVNIACDNIKSNYASSRSFEIIYSNPTKAQTYILLIPETWYSEKKGNTLTVAQGVLTVRELNNNSGLLFRKGDSKNIYLWKNGSQKLLPSTEAEWDKAINEKNRFVSDNKNQVNSELVLEKNFPMVIENLFPPRGKEILEIERINNFIKIKSFDGKKQKSKSILPFLGGGDISIGDFFLEFYFLSEKSPILILKKHGNSEDMALTEEFWYNKSIYIIEDLDSIIINVLTKHN